MIWSVRESDGQTTTVNLISLTQMTSKSNENFQHLKKSLNIFFHLSSGSMSVNVSATSSSGRSEYVNAGQFSDNAAPQKLSLDIIRNTLMLLLLVINMFLQHTDYATLPKLQFLYPLLIVVVGELFVVTGVLSFSRPTKAQQKKS